MIDSMLPVECSNIHEAIRTTVCIHSHVLASVATDPRVPWWFLSWMLAIHAFVMPTAGASGHGGNCDPVTLLRTVSGAAGRITTLQPTEGSE